MLARPGEQCQPSEWHNGSKDFRNKAIMFLADSKTFPLDMNKAQQCKEPITHRPTPVRYRLFCAHFL